jgi:ABC-type phosphate transport system permease subunit
VLFAVGLVLFLITFLINSLAARLVRRSQGARRGAGR